METLLRNYDPDISLETENLKTMAEALTTKENGGPSEMVETSPSVTNNQDQTNDVEDLTLDEDFTVKPLPHNTTRMFTTIGCILDELGTYLCTDYSGEFSYWNFSMRIKRWIEDWAPNSNSEVRI